MHWSTTLSWVELLRKPKYEALGSLPCAKILRCPDLLLRVNIQFNNIHTHSAHQLFSDTELCSQHCSHLQHITYRSHHALPRNCVSILNTKLRSQGISNENIVSHSHWTNLQKVVCVCSFSVYLKNRKTEYLWNFQIDVSKFKLQPAIIAVTEASWPANERPGLA